MGGAGYTGGEMIRLLLNHPEVELSFVHSRNYAGKPICTVHKDLAGDTELIYTDTIAQDVDVIFLCVGHGEAVTLLQESTIASHIKIIDLSQDFRLSANSRQQDRSFVYGLPEYQKEKIKTAQNIANPGCFATAIQLALLPLAGQKLLKNIHITGITGSTGAGQKLQSSSHFSWRANNIQPYKTLQHQHMNEVMQTLAGLQQSQPILHFIPWRGDFPRGIFISAQLPSELTEDQAYDLFSSYYANTPFTHVSREMIDLKQVVNTNKCMLHIEKVDDQLVVHSAIDNLLKGASGQAVQNMNIMFGLPETAGLKLKSIAF